MKDFWDERNILKDLLFETNKSLPEIARELDISQKDLKHLMDEEGLGWVRRKNRKMSRGHSALYGIMQELLPKEEIITEHHLGERLLLDIYCPKYKLGAEYHGRQHFVYSNLFFEDQKAFQKAQARDARKEELCRKQGIALIVFRYCDKLTYDSVYERMLDAIRATEYIPEERVSRYVGNDYYERMKQLAKERNRKNYQTLKKRRRDRNT